MENTSIVSIQNMYETALNKDLYDKLSMGHFICYHKYNEGEELRVVDMTNALKGRKDCGLWLLTVKQDEDGYAEPICNLLEDGGINTTVELMTALRAGSLSVAGVKITESTLKGVKTFSPFYNVAPIKQPKRWSVLLAVKALLAGQAELKNCDWDYAFGVVKKANEGYHSYGAYENNGTVTLYSRYVSGRVCFKFKPDVCNFPDGCTNILEAKEWQEEQNRKKEAEKRKRDEEERERRFSEKKALRSIIENAMKNHPLHGVLPPYVDILWSEHPAFYELIPDDDHSLKVSILAANDFLGKLDMNRFNEGRGGYYKTRFNLHYIDPTSGEHKVWEGRYDLGDGYGGMFQYFNGFRPRADLIGLFTILDAYNAVLSSKNGEGVNTTVAIWDGLEAFRKAYMGNKGNN